MKCPYCSTENREDRETCYHCGKDISMLRLIVNKARHHYNVALEHAERQRYAEALAELQHCLELDHSFLPAHVVRGTVYAKMEKFDEAERCWREALTLDSHVAKAHDYIDKSHLARRAVPLLRRLRWVAVGAVILAIVFGALVVWQLRPTTEKAMLVRIAEEIENDNLPAAFTLAQRLDESARRAEVRHAARLLSYSVKQKYEAAALDILTFLLDNRPVEAHELYQRLTTGQPPPDPYMRQLQLLDQKASAQAVVLLDSWRSEFEAGTIAYEDLVQRGNRFRQVFLQPEIAARVDSTLAMARRVWVGRTLEQLPSSPLSTSETLAWLGRLNDLAQRAPESRNEVASATIHVLAAGVGQVEQRMKKAVAAKDPAALRLALSDLDRLVAFGRNEETDRLAQKAREDLKRLEMDRLKTRLSAATAADIPQVDGWLDALAKATSVTVETDADVSATVARARRKLAAEVVSWCSERDTRFQQRKITNDEARWITERAEFALRYSAARTWRYTRDCVMFCAAIGWLQLGKPPEALQWLDRLEKTYSESPYLSAARRVRQQIKATEDKSASPSGSQPQ